MKFFKLHWLLVILLAFPMAILLPTNQGYAQSRLIINEEINPGGSQVTHETSDNTLLYVLGAAIVTGIVIYAVLKHKKKKEAEADTTAVIEGLNSSAFANEFGSIEHQYTKAKDKVPFDLFLGIRENKALVSDKTYLMGVSFKF